MEGSKLFEQAEMTYVVFHSFLVLHLPIITKKAAGVFIESLSALLQIKTLDLNNS